MLSLYVAAAGAAVYLTLLALSFNLARRVRMLAAAAVVAALVALALIAIGSWYVAPIWLSSSVAAALSWRNAARARRANIFAAQPTREEQT